MFFSLFISYAIDLQRVAALFGFPFNMKKYAEVYSVLFILEVQWDLWTICRNHVYHPTTAAWCGSCRLNNVFRLRIGQVSVEFPCSLMCLPDYTFQTGGIWCQVDLENKTKKKQKKNCKSKCEIFLVISLIFFSAISLDLDLRGAVLFSGLGLSFCFCLHNEKCKDI